ncbi:MAG TPA: H-NS histone family protein [Paracoccaceae bacterium]|nr:H-NS histone family protein [Paracoccaceae bacterium]
MKINLKGMSRKELEKLRADVDKALEQVSTREMDAAIKAAEKAAAAHGFSLAQLTGGEVAAPKKRGRKPGAKAAKPKKAGVPRYKNPADASQTWTGKGRQPVWFKDAVAAGADPESMAI